VARVLRCRTWNRIYFYSAIAREFVGVKDLLQAIAVL
jgi:hypothetical protein